jgi:dTDP-L-rhamnose 4-epimerase
VCHQVAIVAHGLDPSDVLPGAMHSAKMRRLMLASSMVVYGKGRYTCVEHGVVRPARRGGPADLAAGRIEPVYRVAEGGLAAGVVPQDARLPTRFSSWRSGPGGSTCSASPSTKCS